MAGCNNECNCYLEGDDGLLVDGLGEAAEPYVIGTDTGRHIPQAGTSAERAALSVSDALMGLTWYETDTGIVYVYEGATYGWVPQSVMAIESSAASTTLSAAAFDPQLICSVALAAGTWAVWGKANIEAILTTGTGWDAFLRDDTAVATLDQTSMAVSGGESPSGASTYWRPFAVQDLVTLAVPSTVAMRVSRASTGGTQVVNHAKLMAVRIAGNR